MDFSKRTNWSTQLNPLAQKTEELRQDPDFLNLTVSNPTECGFSYLQPSLLQPLLDPANLCYTPDPRGLLSARKAVVNYYRAKGIFLSVDQILITASTSEAYSFIFKILAGHGDTLIGPAPGYPLMDYLAEINDVSLHRYNLHYQKGWAIDPKELRCLPKAKAALVVHPSNPAGNYVQPHEQDALAAWAGKHQSALISDEVFYDFHFGAKPSAPSFAAQNDVLTFTLSGISKILGLPQMKLSWIVITGPEAQRIEAMHRLEIVADTYLSASTVIQNALPQWLDAAPAIQAEIHQRIRTNRTFLQKSFENHPAVEVLEADGGWTSILKVPGIQTDEEWALLILEKSKVLLHPGYLFDLSENMTALVLSLIVPEKAFREGLARLSF